MKWMIFLAVLGVAEVATTGQLHAVLGTLNLVILYVVTTGLGVLFLFLKLPKFGEAMSATKKAQVELRDKFEGQESQFSAQEIEKYGPMIFVGLYGTACLLIAVPGVVSDIAGILLVFPFLSDKILSSRLKKAVARAETRP